MKTKKRLSMLGCLVAYFAGALTAVYFLAPGKVSPADLLKPEKWSQLADWDQAGQKVARAGDLTAYYAHRAKDYVHDKFAADK